MHTLPGPSQSPEGNTPQHMYPLRRQTCSSAASGAGKKGSQSLGCQYYDKKQTLLNSTPPQKKLKLPNKMQGSGSWAAQPGWLLLEEARSTRVNYKESVCWLLQKTYGNLPGEIYSLLTKQGLFSGIFELKLKRTFLIIGNMEKKESHWWMLTVMH